MNIQWLPVSVYTEHSSQVNIRIWRNVSKKTLRPLLHMKCKFVHVFLIEHHAMKAYSGVEI
jgi:hypothetical protein